MRGLSPSVQQDIASENRFGMWGLSPLVRSILKVQIRLSKKPRFIAECFFADQHRLTIQKLAIGDILQIRGNCRNIFEASVELLGCAITQPDSEPGAGVH